MGYEAKKVPWKKGPGWKLQYISYTNEAAKGKKTNRKIKDIDKNDWNAHGFSIDMTLEQAKAKAKALNAQKEIKRWNETKIKIRERLDKEDTVECAYLPEPFVAEFEKDILFEKICRNSEIVQTKNKTDSHWRAVKRIIREVKLDHSEWGDKPFKFYNYFVSKKWSPSYVQKLLRILNEWGVFMSRKSKVPYFPIPDPPSDELTRIRNAFWDKTPKGDGQDSDPLTHQMLEAQKGNLKVEHYNWLFISVWFGLRPQEIDELNDGPFPCYTSVSKKTGRTLLHIYQPKLRAVPRPQRWKVIPIKYKEQEDALAMIQSKEFKRPIGKVIHHWFGERIKAYGGRNNFTDMMLDKGEDFLMVSRWMGHVDIQRTYKDYQDRLNTDVG